jgi:protein-tyrosine phosphatase
VSGHWDLHCHLLFGLDDGARSLEDSLEMARVLVELGFAGCAPSPHARAEYATREVALARLSEVQAALSRQNIPLQLLPNAENAFLEPQFLQALDEGTLRCLGTGKVVLIEAPYASPLPSLSDFIFRLKLKGYSPLIAHPERCLEFERKGRAAEVVQAGASLQLDVGALIGRYGGTAKKLAQSFLGDGLYAVAATDLHSPVGARDWLPRAFKALRTAAGEAEVERLLADRPERLLRGEVLEV